ncbi:MAG: glycosyltransferase [Candidatus Moranbacteria bacterium]|jgi:rhamnosyltransferase|nr:glycosyltransferase [Candidatus Moranbacteria bacterium]
MTNTRNERKLDVSIVFLLFNGLSDHFEETLKMVRNQEIDKSVEITAIDSGSTDGTVDFVRKNNDINLYQIPNFEFGHGKTRQTGVELASGKYIIFLTQDAIPANEFWLEKLIEKIESDEKIKAVCSRIIPRKDALAIRKYGILGEWSASENDFVIEDFNLGDYRNHDISTLYDRNFLLKNGFDDVSFGEDVLIAKKILASGNKTAFASKSVVFHSHDYEIKKTYKRNLIDGEFNKIYLNKKTVNSIIRLFGLTAKSFLRDLKLLIKDRDINFFEKIINLIYSPVIHFAEMLGQYRGNKK